MHFPTQHPKPPVSYSLDLIHDSSLTNPNSHWHQVWIGISGVKLYWWWLYCILSFPDKPLLSFHKRFPPRNTRVGGESHLVCVSGGGEVGAQTLLRSIMPLQAPRWSGRPPAEQNSRAQRPSVSVGSGFGPLDWTKNRLVSHQFSICL